MPGTLAWPPSAAEAGLLSLALAAVVLLTVIGVRRWRASRISPEERERRRRAMLVARGKMGDAVLVDVRDELIFFSYSVRGVEYTASQDVSSLHDHVPQDLSALIGVGVKYMPQNPANSIVVAEEWSGLRQLKRS
ncbi:MAG: hypothetical protein WDO73_28725 [Ignavibacteriota bacterium]